MRERRARLRRRAREAPGAPRRRRGPRRGIRPRPRETQDAGRRKALPKKAGERKERMKKISAIVRPEKLEPLKEALFEAKVSGMTISQVQGCGNQHGWKEYYRGSEVMLNMLPKVKFEIVVDDGQVDALVDLISETARTGEVGDGKIFIFPVDQVVRIRTGEKGDSAV